MEKLTAYFKAQRGRQTAMALELGIEPSAISQWTRVPVDHVLKIERITGIPRHELRPDIYPAPDETEAA